MNHYKLSISEINKLFKDKKLKPSELYSEVFERAANTESIIHGHLTLFQDENIKKDIKTLLAPLVEIIYNDLYVYIWSICFFNLFLFVIIILNLVLLLKILAKPTTTYLLEQ